jgi:FolB domain-containing protein
MGEFSLFIRQEYTFEDFYELLIPGLRLWISLGCSVEEKANPQPVDVDIKIKFSKEPLGCRSDQLADVLCYKTIVEDVLAFTKGKSFNLIEALAERIFHCISKQTNLENALVEVAITKPNHPVPHVHKGMVFRYCRRLPQKSL